MNEKEFLIQFINYLSDRFYGLYSSPIIFTYVEEFLTEIHKRYKSVYFYKWQGKEQEIIQEQVRYKLKDFLDYLDLPLDTEYLEAKIDGYVREKL